jgi:hypothetical protein
MAVEVIPRSEQARGAFDGGAILEHKPIGFPQDGGRGGPVSSLFYWAHAWSTGGGLIDQHPHEGFEIMSYVLKGEIEHYDSQLKGWKKLGAGDAQLIRAGDGIVHAEKILPGSAIFQIWFDPNLEQSLAHPASYDDYAAGSFPVRDEGGVRTTVIKGDGAPMAMETAGISIEDQTFGPGRHTLRLDPKSLTAACVIDGALTVGGKAAATGDYVLARDMDQLELEVPAAARWFVITAPARPAYRTYAQMRSRAL